MLTRILTRWATDSQDAEAGTIRALLAWTWLGYMCNYSPDRATLHQHFTAELAEYRTARRTR